MVEPKNVITSHEDEHDDGDHKTNVITGTMMKKRVTTTSKVSKTSSSSSLPSIHEDYFGPRHHKPRHH